MSEPQRSPLSIDERAAYAHRALTRLSSAWMKKTPNLSGMRATFKRWRPDASQEPTAGMRQYVWGWIGSPLSSVDEGETTASEESREESVEQRTARRRREREEGRLIDQAATVVAMRAAAGDHDAKHSLGQALYNADLSDMRLMRLLTVERGKRLENLHRTMRLLDAKKQGVQWTLREVRNVFDFLFGNDKAAQRAANNWAADFFRSRGKTDKDEEETTPEAAVSE